MPEPVAVPDSKSTPDYETLIRFLIQPFLESPDALKLDCEVSQPRMRVWIRVAFEGTDKGRVFGRGGRNIQAIRTVLEAIAQMSGYSVHLDIYGTSAAGYGNEGFDREDGEKSSSRRPQPKRGSPRPRQ